MAAVQQQVDRITSAKSSTRSAEAGGIITVGDTTVRLAKQFGFCLRRLTRHRPRLCCA